MPLRILDPRHRLHGARGVVQGHHQLAGGDGVELLPRRALFGNTTRRATSRLRHRPARHDACAGE
eukprot:4956964-Pleurochrysis_carterae.AAC.1